MISPAVSGFAGEMPGSSCNGYRRHWPACTVTRSVTGNIMIATCGLKPGAGGPPGGGPGGIMTCGAVMPLDSPAAGAAQTGHRP
jgi:hypothetical protein